MSDSGKITANQLIALSSSPYKTVQWRGHMLGIRTILHSVEVVRFVDNVMRMCYNHESDIFVPELMDFAIRVNTIALYSMAELPESMDSQFDIVYGTDLYDFVVKNINQPQIESIHKSINMLASSICEHR